MSVTSDIYAQAVADFERVGVDDIAYRLSRGETVAQIARRLGWPVRLLQRWWKAQAPLQGRKAA